MTDENNENRSDINPEQTPGAEQTPGTEKGAERLDLEQPVIETNKDARTFGMLCHLAGLAGFVFPFGNIVGPLILWMIKKDEFGFVDDQGKEALNFQISITIYSIASGLLFLCGIGIILLPAVILFGLVMLIIATVNANNGIAYRYPLTIRFIK